MKKSIININLIPELVKTNKMTAEKAARFIAEDLIRNPKEYFLISQDEDILSELSLKIIETGPLIIKNYKKDYAQFKTYICSMLKYQTLTIIRNKRKKDFKDKLLMEQPSLHYESQMEMYQNDESPFKIGHYKPFIQKTLDKITYREKRNYKKNSDLFQKKTPSRKGIKDLTDYWKKRTSLKAKTALILALKSSYYITDEYLDNICDYCEISKRLMLETIDELNQSLPEKELKVNKAREDRDRSYNLHLKFQRELNETENKELKLKLLDRYNYHTQKWEKRNKKIQTEGLKISPTNKQISSLLGISERQVGNYIKNADKIAEEIIDELKKNPKNS